MRDVFGDSSADLLQMHVPGLIERDYLLIQQPYHLRVDCHSYAFCFLQRAFIFWHCDGRIMRLNNRNKVLIWWHINYGQNCSSTTTEPTRTTSVEIHRTSVTSNAAGMLRPCFSASCILPTFARAILTVSRRNRTFLHCFYCRVGSPGRE